MATLEDFTFPATATDSSPDSPTLWRRSATAPRREAWKGKEEEGFNLPSLQAFRFSRSAKERSNCEEQAEEGEEKMDMLWEDLNEDGNANNSEISSPRREVQMSCVRGLRLSKANGHIISGKKTSVLVFIKALKKVFLMHTSQRAINNKSSYTN